MRHLLLASVFAAILPVAAQADTVINGVTYLDPTSFHVTSSVATGSDPVLLNNSSSFSIQDIGGQNIDQPLTIYFAEPTGAAAPTISGASYTVGIKGGGSTTTPILATNIGTIANLSGPPTNLGTFATGTLASPSTNDLYTFVGCVACDNSLNGSNITTVFNKEGITLPNSLTIYDVQIQQAFVGGDQVNVDGAFANGTIIFPFAENIDTKGKSVTIYDTSWTNTGFVDCTTGQPGCTTTPPPPPPPPPPVPEPSSIALLGVGLLGLGMVVRHRRRSA